MRNPGGAENKKGETAVCRRMKWDRKEQEKKKKFGINKKGESITFQHLHYNMRKKSFKNN